MDFLLAMRELFYEVYPLLIYGGLTLAYISSWKLIPQVKKTTLFIWTFSVPLTAFIYIFWIEQWPPTPFSRYEILAYGIFLAQLGWLGAALSITNHFINSKKLGLFAFWISVIPSTTHIAYFSLTILSGKSS
jgi:hypothetical protein